jgi:hypothetical protein
MELVKKFTRNFVPWMKVVAMSLPALVPLKANDCKPHLWMLLVLGQDGSL